MDQTVKQNEWLKNLKQGDEVFVVDKFGKQLRKVEDIYQDMGLIKVGGDMFCSDTGFIHPFGYNTCCTLEPVNPKDKDEYEKAQTILKALRLMKSQEYISEEQARRIIDILDPSVE